MTLYTCDNVLYIKETSLSCEREGVYAFNFIGLSDGTEVTVRNIDTQEERTSTVKDGKAEFSSEFLTDGTYFLSYVNSASETVWIGIRAKYGVGIRRIRPQEEELRDMWQVNLRLAEKLDELEKKFTSFLEGFTTE